MKKPVIDMSSCILCEICVDLAPHVFQLNDAGFIDIEEIDDFSDNAIQEAVKNCPKDAIAWE